MSTLRVSAVIPVFNGGTELSRCLDAIAASSYAVTECILVDDASTDGATRQAAEAHQARVVQLHERKGPANARNKGVAEATGDVILFIDADVLLHPEALGAAIAVLEAEPKVAAVFGSYDDEPGDPSFLSQYRNLLHHWVHQTARAEASTFWTGCGVIRREVYMAMGGLDASFSKPSIEDIELGYRLRRSGHALRLQKTMLCKHMKRWKFWNLVKTDIFQRGLPWMSLLLRSPKVPGDLNLNLSSRIATFLAGMLALSVIALLITGHIAALAPTAAFLFAAAACSRVAGSKNAGAALAPILAILAPLAAYLLVPDVLALIPLAFVVLLTWSHAEFIRYVAKRRTAAFALAVIPMLVVFFLSCAIAGALGIVMHFTGAGREPAAR